MTDAEWREWLANEPPPMTEAEYQAWVAAGRPPEPEPLPDALDKTIRASEGGEGSPF